MTKSAPVSTRIVNLIKALASRYTRTPANLKVQGADVGERVILAMKTDRDDHRRLVGSRGKNIIAMQTIARAAAFKLCKVAALTLLDPDSGTEMPLLEFKTDPKWRPASTVKLLRETLGAIAPGDFEIGVVPVGDLTNMVITPKPGTVQISEELGRAVHVLFHAIGKTEGREVHVMLENGTQGN